MKSRIQELQTELAKTRGAAERARADSEDVAAELRAIRRMALSLGPDDSDPAPGVPTREIVWRLAAGLPPVVVQ